MPQRDDEGFIRYSKEELERIPPFEVRYGEVGMGAVARGFGAGTVGTVAGAAIGSVWGPVGTVVGGIAGAVVGGSAGAAATGAPPRQQQPRQ